LSFFSLGDKYHDNDAFLSLASQKVRNFQQRNVEKAKKTGANTTIASYKASAVKIYNATSSLVRFENNFFYKFEKTL
jgi:hypothetical protein